MDVTDEGITLAHRAALMALIDHLEKTEVLDLHARGKIDDRARKIIDQSKSPLANDAKRVLGDLLGKRR